MGLSAKMIRVNGEACQQDKRETDKDTEAKEIETKRGERQSDHQSQGNDKNQRGKSKTTENWREKNDLKPYNITCLSPETQESADAECMACVH